MKAGRGLQRLLHGIEARIAASPTLTALMDGHATARARAVRAAIVGLCLLAHLGLYALLRIPDQHIAPPKPMPAAERPMEIVFIERKPAAMAPLPMPRAAEYRPVRSMRVVRIDPPTPAPIGTDLPASPLPAPAPGPGRSLMEQISGLSGTLPDASEIGVRDPMRPLKPSLPGSNVAIVAGLRLRREVTPEDVVKAVGALFGGGYEPCPDLMGKMHDATIVNPTRYSDAERRDLVESERRCRY